MMQRKWLGLFCFLLIVFSFKTLAQFPRQNISLCENVINQIQSDLAAYPVNRMTQMLPWMNFNWLASQLGEPRAANVYDYVYVWKNFSMFMGADGSIEKIGVLPNNLQAKTFDEVIQIMGRPKQTYSEKLNLYSWACPSNVDSYVGLLTKQDLSSISIMGRNCNGNACKDFSSSYADSNLKLKFDQQMKEQEQASINLLSLRLKNYNDYFKTTLLNQTQLNEDITNKIRNFYASVRQCNKGIYQYAVPAAEDYLYQTSTINLKPDSCIVETTYRIPHIGRVDLKCKFALEHVELFTDKEAQNAAQGAANFDSQHPSQLQKLINSECKRYIDGML